MARIFTIYIAHTHTHTHIHIYTTSMALFFTLDSVKKSCKSDNITRGCCKASISGIPEFNFFWGTWYHKKYYNIKNFKIKNKENKITHGRGNSLRNSKLFYTKDLLSFQTNSSHVIPNPPPPHKSTGIYLFCSFWSNMPRHRQNHVHHFWKYCYKVQLY